jgi:nitroreductase
LVRDVSQTRVLKKTLRREFEWARPPACPEELPLYRLAEGDARDMAKQIACQQDIASDGCFSLAMIAEFKAPLEKHGAWFYPRLYWEAGLIGQLLYLEAEAAGLRSTGIGCFFDDPVHKLLGLENEEFQDLYHFTVGGPVEDTRLTTLPAYPGI